DLPSLPGPRAESHVPEDEGEQARGDELARGHHGVVFRIVEMRARLLAPGDKLVGLARHGGDDDCDLKTRVDLALYMGRDLADALDVGDGRAAEFHHKTRQTGLGSRGERAARARRRGGV